MRHVKCTLLLAALSLGLAQAAQAAPALQANLLKNPSFEPDLSNWSTYSVPGGGGCGNQVPNFGTINKSVDARRVHAGDNAAVINIAGGKSYQAGLQQTIGNRPALMLAILLIILGAQFISLGLLGEMITYQNQKQEKGYRIQEVLH